MKFCSQDFYWHCDLFRLHHICSPRDHCVLFDHCHSERSRFVSESHVLNALYPVDWMRAAELWLATCMPVVHELSLTMTKPWWCNRESAIIFAVIFNICCYFLFFLSFTLSNECTLFTQCINSVAAGQTTGFSIISEFWCSIQLNIRSIGVNECSTANTNFESNEYALHMFQSANLNEFSGLESTLRYFIW